MVTGVECSQEGLELLQDDWDFDAQTEAELWERALEGEPVALRALAENLEQVDDEEIGFGD